MNWDEIKEILSGIGVIETIVTHEYLVDRNKNEIIEDIRKSKAIFKNLE